MRNAHAVADVRAAETRSWPACRPGALMQRAAAGLAAVCAACCHGSTARAWWCWPAAGTTAATRCTREPGWPAAARWCSRSPRAPGCTPGARPRCGPRADGVTGPSDPGLPATMNAADLVLDGLLGIGGRGGLREPQAALAALAEAARAGHGTTVVAVDLPSGVDADTGEVPGAAVQRRRHGHVRHLEDRAAHRPRRRPRRAGAPGGHRPGTAPARARRGRLWRRRRGRAAAAARPRVGQVPPRGPRHRGGQRPVHRGRGARRGRRAARRGGHGAPGDGRARRGRGAAALAGSGDHGDRGHRWRGRHRRAGSRPGWPVPAWAPTSRPAAGSRRCSPPTCRCWWTPTGSRWSAESPGAGRRPPGSHAAHPARGGTGQAAAHRPGRGHRAARRARAGRGARLRLLRAAQGLHHGDRGRTAARCWSTRPVPAGWPPQAPATCSPGWRARCSPRGLTLGEAAAAAAYLHGISARYAAGGAGQDPAAKRRSGRVT